MRLKRRIAATIFLLQTGLVVIVATTFQVLSDAHRADRATISEDVHLQHLSHLSRAALLTEDYAELQVFIEEATRDPSIEDVVVVDVFRKAVASSELRLLGRPFRQFNGLAPHEYSRHRHVDGYGQRLGTVHARFTAAPRQNALDDALERTLWVAAIGIIASAIVAWMLGQWLAKRLATLARASASVAAGGTFEAPAVDDACPEVRQLADSIATMVVRLHERTSALERARDQLTVPTEAMAQGFALWDHEDRLERYNGRLAELFGVPAASLATGVDSETYANRLETGSSRRGLADELRQHRATTRRRGRATFELELGDERAIQVDEAVTRDNGIVTICTDVSDRRRHALELERKERRLDLVMSCVLDGLILIDRSAQVLHLNPAAERMLGFDTASCGRLDLRTLLKTEPSWWEVLGEPQAGPLLIEGELGRTDGSSLPVELALVRAGDEEPDLFIVGLRDISARKHAEAELRFAATHDRLTGVLNHSEMQVRVTVALERARARQGSCALLFVDLDGFKLINDTAGHVVGDAVLAQVAARLRLAVADKGVVGRLGGDEFGVLLTDDVEVRSAGSVADEILAALRRPFEAGTQRPDIGASIGIALYPDHAATDTDLFRAADIALYRAKRAGGHRWSVFRRHEAARARHRVTLAQRLDRALELRELHLAYQPQYTVRDGRLVGFEALVRWTSGIFGPIPPDVFIPIAEETGQIHEIGEWVLLQSVEDLAKLLMVHGSDLRMAVNVSPRQLENRRFVLRTRDIVGAKAGLVSLELTERVLMDGGGTISRQLDALCDAELKLVLDDFGTGYSSLNHLRSFRISEVKIDRSFIADLLVDPTDAQLVRALITLCKDLDLTVTAEGIENEGQLDWLRAAGCVRGQGYLLGRPMPLAEALELVRRSGDAAPELRRAAG